VIAGLIFTICAKGTFSIAFGWSRVAVSSGDAVLE